YPLLQVYSRLLKTTRSHTLLLVKLVCHNSACDIDGNLFACTRNLSAISATGVRLPVSTIFTKYFTSKVHSAPCP
ncbi:hypothetical protein, partial [Salmonella enterica]